MKSAESLANEIVDLINTRNAEEKFSCGDLIELLCNLNASIAVWLGESLDIEPKEVIDDVYKIILKQFEIEKGADAE